MFNLRKILIYLYLFAVFYAFIYGTYIKESMVILCLASLLGDEFYVYLTLYMAVFVRTCFFVQNATRTESFIISAVNLLISSNYESVFTKTFVEERNKKYVEKREEESAKEKDESFFLVKEDFLLIDGIFNVTECKFMQSLFIVNKNHK
ncbi:hypothetical protein H311_03927 [Anncaliia algerae PRA109]|nr:hypothetical protein H311_03927 [Anncaliia algerae PRA109]